MTSAMLKRMSVLVTACKAMVHSMNQANPTHGPAPSPPLNDGAVALGTGDQASCQQGSSCSGLTSFMTRHSTSFASINTRRLMPHLSLASRTYPTPWRTRSVSAQGKCGHAAPLHKKPHHIQQAVESWRNVAILSATLPHKSHVWAGDTLS